MEIKTYDQVDPEQVLRLNLMALNYPLTPEMAVEARRLDPRVMPGFALYAVQGDLVLGQVGMFEAPVVTREGPARAGALTAVSTHPEHGRGGVARTLILDAHRRMRERGARFVTLGTSRFLVAHSLYRSLGYSDLVLPANAFSPIGGPANRGAASTGPSLTPARPGLVASLLPPTEEHLLVAIHDLAAAGRFGFVNRPAHFAGILRAWGESINAFIIRDENKEDAAAPASSRAVGYALVSSRERVVSVLDLEVVPDVDPGRAAVAIAQAFPDRRVRIRTVMRDAYRRSMTAAGFEVVHDWGTLMAASLDGTPPEEVRRLLGVDENLFHCGFFDIT
ncbi:MAG: GNAT family N-acetyltransferase [Bacillota bacterium]